ncbi:isochorismatase family protein [Thozetella sp. PMI_491]|nr:isochorismatase family protein [Thozetella sp. PMI_491]
MAVKPLVASSIEARPYKWPHNASFCAETTALVVIDMQVDFCAPGGYLDFQGIPIDGTRAVIPQIQSLLAAFRRAGFPVYHTREGHRPDLSTLSSRELLRSRNNPSGKGIGDEGPLGRLLVRGEKGHDIIPELAPLPTEPIVDKPGRSAFQHTDFKLLLDNRGIKNLVICGVTTDVCVSSTMRDGNDMGLDCVLVTNASAAGEPALHEATVESICAEGGIFGAVTTTESILQAFESSE